MKSFITGLIVGTLMLLIVKDHPVWDVVKCAFLTFIFVAINYVMDKRN